MGPVNFVSRGVVPLKRRVSLTGLPSGLRRATSLFTKLTLKISIVRFYFNLVFRSYGTFPIIVFQFVRLSIVRKS